MSTSPAAPTLTDLLERLPELMLRDEQRLGRRLDGARRIRKPRAREAVFAEIAERMAASEHRVSARRAAVPTISYPPELPVSERKDSILEAIRDHQVVIVAGETGSGKTTQIPKICLELGRGVRGLIGHTQPRRIAARTVAERVAQELGSTLGEVVGWKVRFTDQVRDDTLVKLMTDGILLAEIQTDRELRQYDTLIIDEAHERSLNIDFLLGYLAQLLPRRPDLKVVITSATIDPERFARHFGSVATVRPDGPGERAGASETGAGAGPGERPSAPVVEVSGRTYPVEVRYRPLLDAGPESADGPESPDGPDGPDDAEGVDTKPVKGARRGPAKGAKPRGGGRTAERQGGEGERDQIAGICAAVDELLAEGPGDVLVFLSGEREIRDTADALGKRQLPGTEVLPLYARLSHAEQQRVFQRHAGRRVVLATNVAETSLTVPGIKYVIDPGTARISRYSHRTKVQRLPIERISQASANQRKGRCGRTSDGICIRLYSEEDFLSRPEFTDAEILRTNLASVILQMTTAGLGEIEKFPFIDPPDARSIKAGVQLLEELGALAKGKLTPAGRQIAQLPVDPRLARMVLEADRTGCVREVMVIAAALSIQDPRERPVEKQAQADQQHARFKDETSDFLAFLNLWRYVREQQRELSSSAFRRMCKAEFLNYLRIREWQDIYAQLRQMGRSIKLEFDEGAPPVADDQVHRALLPGLLSHLGLKDPEKNEYLGARGAKFAVFPGSSLFRKQPRWIMSAELVETSRLWARVNARIEPEWVEPLAEHLVKRTYSEPHWEQKQAAVMAYERVTLYGVPLVAQRKVHYGRIDQETSRDLFIRHALVEGDWRTQHAFFQANRRLLDEVEELEHRARRRDILVDDETLYDFYDQRIPEDVVSGAHFDSWWKKRRRDDPELLNFEKSMLINERARQVTVADYPDVWPQGRLRFPVTYQFEPGTDADGVTVHVPLQVLNQVTAEGFDWQIPGLRADVVTELIRSLPKAVRRHCVPAPDVARRFLAGVDTGEGTGEDPGGDAGESTGGGARPVSVLRRPLTAVLAEELRRLTGVRVEPEDFDWEKVPEHLRVTFRVVDERQRKLAEDRDIEALQTRLRSRTQEAISRAFDSAGRSRGGRSTDGRSASGGAGARERAREAERGGADRGAGGAAEEPALAQRTGLTRWTLGALPRTFETTRAGQPVRAYPALVDEGESVAVRLCDTEDEQRDAMWRGTRRLILLNIPSDPAKFAQSRMSNQQKLALSRSPHGSVQALFEDCVTATTDQLVATHGGPAWDEESFHKLFEAVRADLVEATLRTVSRVQQVLAAWHSCQQRLLATNSPSLRDSRQDVEAQLAALIRPGFVTLHGADRLADLLRYLTAADRRLQQLPNNAERDRSRMAKVREAHDEYLWLLERFPAGRPVPRGAREIRWMVEELRVSYYAHALGTAYPVSDKRIAKAVDAQVPPGR
ncbi:ATP-dependent RNA helicase HrpA [Streptomyces oceani]|uniref:RNA helicase n=1 Tax=Streptomyces oceani TaxID=1075402 RepID=A0A1E7JXA1_9ACTN|nr:ATP-dependent RNA helicase HrpA [Streptomyces oceani]OEU96299.1 ATP-dependent RNA helicase HrpA [Streptomyces oceani]